VCISPTCSKLNDFSESVLRGILNLGSVLLDLAFVGRFVGVSEVDTRGGRESTDSRDDARASGGDKRMVELSVSTLGLALFI
jgi:hypothetical protein